MHAHGVLCRVKDGVHNFLLRKEWKILAPRHKVNRSGKRETKGETPAAGRFEDNAFTLLPGQVRELRWLGPEPLDRATLRVRHLAESY